MALWGNNDNVTSTGTVSLTYSTGEVVGSATSFSSDLSVGQVIRFGERSGTYFGDAVITGITSETVLTIGSTAGLSGAAISGANFTVSELPKYTVLDSKYSEASYGTNDSFVYGISTSGSQAALTSAYEVGTGWVGVTTYVDNHGNFRVKKEILVAMSGIQTGNAPVYDADPTA
jgi:hypothetical protein